jgi:hypothetical protein
MRCGVAVVAAVVILAPSPAVDAALASDCTPQATRTALASFVAAFNRNEDEKLGALFAQLPLFQWYSSNVPGLRTTAAARDRDGLIAYFRSRHVKRDRLRLVSFTFTGDSPGYGNFVFKMKRSAADYRRGAWFGLTGKGAAVCSAQSVQPVQFIVVSLGGPGSDKR